MSDQDWPSDEVMINALVEDFVESDAVPEPIKKEVGALYEANSSHQALELILRECE